MFTAKPQKNRQAATQYFDEHLSQNDYYTQGETQAGYWIGAGAEHLGLKNDTFFSIPINRFGTLGRNTFRGPAFYDFDFALIKDTPFGHRGNAELGNVEFRAEFFNLFNIVNFGLPSNIVRGSGFGMISKTSGTSRQIQFSLKVIY